MRRRGEEYRRDMGVAFIALGGPRLIRYLGLNLMNSFLGEGGVCCQPSLPSLIECRLMRLVLVDVHLVGGKGMVALVLLQCPRVVTPFHVLLVKQVPCATTCTITPFPPLAGYGRWEILTLLQKLNWERKQRRVRSLLVGWTNEGLYFMVYIYSIERCRSQLFSGFFGNTTPIKKANDEIWLPGLWHNFQVKVEQFNEPDLSCKSCGHCSATYF
jgi:hypothetical protein